MDLQSLSVSMMKLHRFLRKDYRGFLQQFRQTSNRLLLGEPSYVMEGDEQVVSIDFTGDDIENLCVLTNNSNNFQKIL